jgi:putative hydrolase of the HAD superfamily
MTPAPLLRPPDWGAIQLVVFDVDGTLYNQRLLRAFMARDLLFRVVSRGDLRVLSVLRAYRTIRERLGDQEVADFQRALISGTAAAAGVAPDYVLATVKEWMEERPLPYLARSRYPGLVELFSGLKRNGKTIGVLSDYPARAKLAALDLGADHVVSAGDEGVGVLKPHTRGLEVLMAGAAVDAGATLVIGDRVDRDGEVARRMGVRALIRSSTPIRGWQTFSRFDGALFAPMLDSKT